MKELQFTLYEVFGYLVPGAVFCGGLGLLFWAIYFPQRDVQFDLKTVEVWATFLASAYIGGHVAQSLGNKLVGQFKTSEEKIVTDGRAFPAELVKACREKAERILKAEGAPELAVSGGSEPAAELPPQWLYRLCDDAVLRSGRLGEREVYVYREGFYRGTFVGFVVLAGGLVALAIRLWSDPNEGTARIGIVELTGWRLVYFSVLAGVSSCLLWNRYWRFSDYRVTQALIGFLTIKDKAGEKTLDVKKEEPK